MGPVTVIGTGNTPLSQIQGVSPRDYFYDAPLANLTQAPYSTLTRYESFTASTDFMASVGFPANGTGGFTDQQLYTLQTQIAQAKQMGIGARYWDTPAWPTRTRNYIWSTLVDLGVVLLNADSLDEAAGFSDGGGYWG